MSEEWPSQTVADGLARIEAQSRMVQAAGLAVMKADSGRVFPVDLLAHAALKRHASTAAAFALLSAHLVASYTGERGDVGSLRLEFSEEDCSFPESSWIEIIDCFMDITSLLLHYLQSWAFTKEHPRKSQTQEAEEDQLEGEYLQEE